MMDKYTVARQKIALAERFMEDNEYADSMHVAAGCLRDLEVAKLADVNSLIWMLERGEYGCHKNDVLGVIEIMEKYMSENPLTKVVRYDGWIEN